MDKKFLQAPYYNIYLVRHGQSIGNKHNLLGGWTDVPLTEEGKSELRAMRDKLPYPAADLYLYSGLSRARQTLEVLTDKAEEARPDWRFSETYFGLMEASPPEDEHLRPNFYRNFYRDNYQGFGEETFSDQQRRTKQGLKDILHELKDTGHNSAYIFCHYGTIKTIMAAFTDRNTDDLFGMWIPNGSLWHFIFQDLETSAGLEEEEINSESSGPAKKQNIILRAGFACHLIRGYYLDYESGEPTDQLLWDTGGLGDKETLLS